eukprot:5201911-Prymnesium_polylepis.1
MYLRNWARGLLYSVQQCIGLTASALTRESQTIESGKTNSETSPLSCSYSSSFTHTVSTGTTFHGLHSPESRVQSTEQSPLTG